METFLAKLLAPADTALLSLIAFVLFDMRDKFKELKSQFEKIQARLDLHLEDAGLHCSPTKLNLHSTSRVKN